MKQKFIYKVVLLFAAALLSACGGGGGGGGDTVGSAQSSNDNQQPVVVSGCATKNIPNPWSGEDYTKSIGDYTVSTNTWNKQMLTEWSVCIQSASLTQNGIKAIFDIDWPFLNTGDAVRSYTNVTYTPNPGFENPHSWFGTKALDPIPITSLSDYIVNHDLKVEYSGYSQTFYSFALDPSSVKFMDRAPLVEMGINLHPLAQTPDNVIDTITVNGNTYWVQSWESMVGDQRLVSLAFQSQAQIFKASIPLKPFFDYILEKNIFPRNYYLHSIQLGMEAFSGKGAFTINDFSVTKQSR